MAAILENGSLRAREIDSSEVNKFRFDWLSKTVNVKDTILHVGESIKKVDISGKAFCALCSDYIYYGKRGFTAISDHLKTKKHLIKEQTRKVNYALPRSFFKTETAGEGSVSVINTPVNVSLCDRIVNQQAMILSTLAEHNLSFSMAPVLVELSKTLAADKNALSHLSMDRTTASYKMKFGLAQTFLQETVVNLQKVKFSLNVDEATSSNHKRVLCVLVSYFSPTLNQTVIEHLVSFSVTYVNAATLYQKIVDFFSQHQIPWENLISILMDSCAVMRGSKSGLETRIRLEKAPHLLDIDGDSCHHVHNASKKFCKPFGCWIENYLSLVYKDLKWSADLREFLSEICLILQLKYTEAENMVSHRWLSCYDATLGNLRLFDAFTILYYSFVEINKKHVFLHILLRIYREKNVSEEGRARIKEIQKQLQKKNMTADGKIRKSRIVERLFQNRKKTLLIMHFYVAVLPLLKKYVCLFQSKEPLVHKLHDEQKQLFLDFLACFLKQELLQKKSAQDLIQMDVSLPSSRLREKDIFYGSGVDTIVASSSVSDIVIKNFYEQATSAYVQCAQHLQKTLPLQSELLICLSAIDPTARGHAVTTKRLKKLPELITNVLNKKDTEHYALEIHQYQVDEKIASPQDHSGNLIRIDNWWSNIFNLPKYPALSKMVSAILSCFHGPQVESTFSMMTEIIDKRSGNMKIDTYSAVQTVKYKLRSSNLSSIQYFKKNDYLQDPINLNLCRNIRQSKKNYEKEKEENRMAMEREKEKLKVQSNDDIKGYLISKHKVNEAVKLAQKKSKLCHKRKLELLAKKVQQKKARLQ